MRARAPKRPHPQAPTHPPTHHPWAGFSNPNLTLPKPYPSARSALAISGASRAESFRNVPEDNEDLSTFQISMFIIMLVITILVLFAHFAEAWKVLPGAHLISGQGIPRIKIMEDLLSIYVASRLLILAYFVLYVAFSIAREDGWGYQLYLVAWVLSLFAQFKSFVSVIWLAVTTGVFLQGIGVSVVYILCGVSAGRVCAGGLFCFFLCCTLLFILWCIYATMCVWVCGWVGV